MPRPRCPPMPEGTPRFAPLPRPAHPRRRPTPDRSPAPPLSPIPDSPSMAISEADHPTSDRPHRVLYSAALLCPPLAAPRGNHDYMIYRPSVVFPRPTTDTEPTLSIDRARDDEQRMVRTSTAICRGLFDMLPLGTAPPNRPPLPINVLFAARRSAASSPLIRPICCGMPWDPPSRAPSDWNPSPMSVEMISIGREGRRKRRNAYRSSLCV